VLGGRNLAAYANTYTKEAIDAIVAIARGNAAASHPYPVEIGPDYHPRRRQPRNGGSAQTQEVERRVQEQIEKLFFIPWNVRLDAWKTVLDRAVGKPFQAVEIFEDKDLTITFQNAEEARQKLIESGLPAALLTPPQPRLVNPDVVRREAQEDNEEYRRAQHRA